MTIKTVCTGCRGVIAVEKAKRFGGYCSNACREKDGKPVIEAERAAALAKLKPWQLPQEK